MKVDLTADEKIKFDPPGITSGMGSYLMTMKWHATMFKSASGWQVSDFGMEPTETTKLR